MADNLAQYGFRYHANRGYPSPSHEIGRIASAFAGSDVNAAPVGINVGDPLKKVSDGTLALAAGGDAVFGICSKIWPYSDGTKLIFSKSLPRATVGVVGGPNEVRVSYIPVAGNLFEIDCDENTTAVLLTTYISYIGENADHINSGDTGTLSLNPRLDISTHGTGTAQWRIVDVSPTAMNQDFTGNYVKLIVTANEVQQAPFQTTGV